MKVTVVFDIYSGLVNPQWDLTPDESKVLIKRLDSLPESGIAISDGGLGYSGFFITIVPDTLKKTSQNVRVFKNIILTGSKNYQDIHGLEKWLLGLATDRGYGAIVKEIKTN